MQEASATIAIGDNNNDDEAAEVLAKVVSAHLPHIANEADMTIDQVIEYLRSNPDTFHRFVSMVLEPITVH
jgi:hypothetical protein